MISLIEEDDDGRWNPSIKRFLSADPITKFIDMNIPHGIILSAPITSNGICLHIKKVRKCLNVPHPLFLTRIVTIKSTRDDRPLLFSAVPPILL